MSVGHAQNFWDPEVAKEEARFRNHRRSRPVPGYVTGTMLVRRSVFDQIGLFNENLEHGDSLEWVTRARRASVSIELIPDVLLMRRLHLHNRSRLEASRSYDEFLGLVKAVLDDKRKHAAQ